MKPVMIIGALAFLAAGCAQNAAPPPAVGGSTPIPAVTDSASPVAAPMPRDLSGAGVTLSANYPTEEDQVLTNVLDACRSRPTGNPAHCTARPDG